MAKITLHGMFARVRGKFNRSETLYFKRCNCGKEQLGVDLLNPVKKSKNAKVLACQAAMKSAVAAAQAALEDPTERAELEAGFAKQRKYDTLQQYAIAQKYVRPDFGN